MSDSFSTKFNENNPWGKSGLGSKVVSIEGKTIADGLELYRATQAVINNTATPEQAAIVQGTDALIQHVAASRPKEEIE